MNDAFSWMGKFPSASLGMGRLLGTFLQSSSAKAWRTWLLAVGSLVISASSIQAGGPEVVFAPYTPSPLPFWGGRSFHIKLPDMNNDGKLDVVVQCDEGRLFVVQGNGDGTFKPELNAYLFSTKSANQNPPNYTLCQGLVVTDFNHDGKQDVVVAENAFGKIHVFLGNGDGTLQPAGDYLTGNAATARPVGLLTADFDRDTHPDLAVLNLDERSVRIFYGNGAGGFPDHWTMPVAKSSAFATGDFNQDGWPDLFTTGEGNIRAVTNGHARGNFSGLSTSGALPNLGAAAFANLGGAHDSFIVFGNNSANYNYVQLTPNIFTIANAPSVGYLAPGFPGASQSLALADMNGDGQLDVVGGIQGIFSGGFHILTGNGDGTLSKTKLYSPDVADIRYFGVDVGDLNGDGRPDVVAATYMDRFDVWLQANPPTITSPSNATFEIGFASAFTATANQSNVTFSFVGARPGGVAFTADGKLSGTPVVGSEGNYPLTLIAQNSSSQSVTQNFTLNVIPLRVPTMGLSSFSDVTSSSAKLLGRAESDNGFGLTQRGIAYAQTSVNASPKVGGAGVLINLDPENYAGAFLRTVTGLDPLTDYSFAAFAVNARGTSYSAVVTFQTGPPPGAGSLTVTTLLDEGDATSEPNLGTGTSLREAVGYANALGGVQTITFSPNLFVNGPARITLTRGAIVFANLTGTNVIMGPGARQLEINGNGSRIFIMDAGSAALTGLTLAHGRGADGGAIRSYGNLMINDCILTDNIGSLRGGAIYNGGAGWFRRTTFSANQAGGSADGTVGLGGAIGNEGYLTVVNCTFFENRADNATGTGGGGAIANLYGGSFAVITSCTVVSNSASGQAGGVYIPTGLLFMNNSIVSGNDAPSGPNVVSPPLYTSSYNLIDANVTNIFATGLLADNGGPTPTVALKLGGLAVNTGSNELAVDGNAVFANPGPLTTDQRGELRIISGTVDIGAYEAPVPPTIISPTVTDVTATTAALGGNVTEGGYPAITRRGVVFARTADNENPTLGGPGVTVVEVSGTTGAFTVEVAGLQPLTQYSFVAFAENAAGLVQTVTAIFRTVEAKGLVVTIPTDVIDDSDNETSLREAVAYANSLTGSHTISFASALGGQAVTLSEGWNDSGDDTALRISGNVIIQGLTAAPGVTLALATGVQKRHFVVEGAGNLTLSHLTLTNGYATEYGGSVQSFGALTVRNCTFTGNYAGLEGGALQSWGGSPLLTVENSTFVANTSANRASAIGAGAVQTAFRHLTITGNTAPNGSVWLYETVALMANTLLAGNSGDGVWTHGIGAFSPQSANNILGAGGVGGLVNGVNENLIGVSSASLHLGVLADNGGPTPTIALLPGSPAINAGLNLPGFDTDQRGLGRVGPVDIGAFEEPTGNDDPDGDGLGNARELALGSNPFAIDSDNDGFNDATEMLAGSNPASNASIPPPTHVERVLGFGLARGLDLTGPFVYALNAGAAGAAGQAGDANFAADNAPGLTVIAGHEIGDWFTLEFGNTPDDETLENVFRSIRWSDVNDADAELRSIKVQLANLVPGNHYKVQLLFAEDSERIRRFDVFVQGVLVVDDFCPSLAQGLPIRRQSGAAIVHEFTASNSTLQIVLEGGNVTQPAGDWNPILNGVTLEALPTAPLITSADRAGFTAGVSNAFIITTAGFPVPVLNLSGSLPAGLQLVNNGNGTATLAGTAASDARGTYALLLTATNGASPDAAQNFTLVVSNRPPLAPEQIFARSLDLSLKIKMADLLAACSDADGDTLALDSVGTSARGATMSKTPTHILYSLAANSDDTFTYTISDGHGGTATGIIQVKLGNPGGLIQSVVAGTGAVTVNFAGIPGFTYDIQRALDPSGPWTPVNTQTAPPNGLFSFTDSNPPVPAAFYRLQKHINP